MKYLYSRLIFSALCLMALAAVPAQAALEVDITESSSSAIPIAIVPFGEPGASLPVDIAQVASDDLESTGLFDVLDRTSMIATPNSPEAVNYANWQAVDADNLVVGSIQPNQRGGYRLRFDILNVYQGRPIARFEINASGSELRDAAHTVANLIYEEFIGEKGYFLSRIAYVAVTRDNGGQRYRLVVSDYDGNNPATIYSSPDPVLSPAWSPDGSRIAYVAYDVDAGRTSLRVQEVATGDIREISSRPGINGAPAWSPDGSQLAITLSFEGSPDIYKYDLRSNQLTRLTRSPSIDTEPTWSPDGQHIAFTSDRGGNPQVYQMSSSGGQAQRLTFSGQSNQRAAYSPDGEQMTLVQNGESGFRIAVLQLDTNNIRIVSDGPLDDSPNFAPNGQAIIYATQGGNNALAVVSTDGEVRSRLSQSGEVREPSWGPAGY